MVHDQDLSILTTVQYAVHLCFGYHQSYTVSLTAQITDFTA